MLELSGCELVKRTLAVVIYTEKVRKPPTNRRAVQECNRLLSFGILRLRIDLRSPMA